MALTLLELLEARGGALTELQLWALGHAAAVALKAHLSRKGDGGEEEEEEREAREARATVLVSPSAICFSGDDGDITFNRVADDEEVGMYCSESAGAPSHTTDEIEKEHVFSLAATLYGAADYGLAEASTGFEGVMISMCLSVALLVLLLLLWRQVYTTACL